MLLRVSENSPGTVIARSASCDEVILVVLLGDCIGKTCLEPVEGNASP